MNTDGERKMETGSRETGERKKDKKGEKGDRRLEEKKRYGYGRNNKEI